MKIELSKVSLCAQDQAKDVLFSEIQSVFEAPQSRPKNIRCHIRLIRHCRLLSVLYIVRYHSRYTLLFFTRPICSWQGF